MIAKADGITHGQAMTNYTIKNNRADMIKTNLLTEGLPPMGMWQEMQLHQERFKNKFARKPYDETSIRIELSPAIEETMGWIPHHWKELLEEYIKVLDSITVVEGVGKKKGKEKGKGKQPDKVKVKPTNIQNSQYFAAIHYDAKSGIPHLHLVVNRLDKDGNLNNLNYIGKRAVAAACIINKRRDWVDAMEIRQKRISEITDTCMSTLRSMPSFNWETYLRKLIEKGYDVKVTRDKSAAQNIRSYSFRFGNSTIPASELGVSKNLTAAHIESTFAKLHKVERTPATTAHPRLSSEEAARYQLEKPQTRQREIGQVKPKEPEWFRDTLLYKGQQYNIKMPLDAYNEMNSHIVAPEEGEANRVDVLNVAMTLFMHYIDAATAMSESSGGGGSAPSSGWGRDKDEFDWARRCALMANKMCKPAIRRGMKR